VISLFTLNFSYTSKVMCTEINYLKACLFIVLFLYHKNVKVMSVYMLNKFFCDS